MLGRVASIQLQVGPVVQLCDDERLTGTVMVMVVNVDQVSQSNPPLGIRTSRTQNTVNGHADPHYQTG